MFIIIIIIIIIIINSTKIHVIKHTWFPNTHSSFRFYDNSRLKNFIFVFFSSYKHTNEVVLQKQSILVSEIPDLYLHYNIPYIISRD
jgi:hypothetical protein